MPRAVGGDLQAAQDAVQAAANDPLFISVSHDLSGHRSQQVDRNWQVCTQEPAAGATFTKDTKVDFGVVKLEETCPGETPTTTATPDTTTTEAPPPPTTEAPPPTTPEPAPTPPPTPAPTPVPPTTSGANVVYANCAAVKAAGKAPLYRGQPGYSSKLDRDGDGVACET